MVVTSLAHDSPHTFAVTEYCFSDPSLVTAYWACLIGWWSDPIQFVGGADRGRLWDKVSNNIYSKSLEPMNIAGAASGVRNQHLDI